MAGEVVGTAFVRIKALTSSLAKDIESQVKKGMEGAKLDKIGGDQGEKLGESLGESSMDSAKKTIQKKSRDIFQDVADEAKITASKLRENLGDGFDDSSSFDRFLDRIKIKLNSADVSLREFFSRTANGFKGLANIDRDSGFDDVLERMGKKLKEFGSDGLPSIGRLPIMIGALAGAVVAALPYIQDIGAAILAYATGLVSQVGFLVTAVGGLGVAAAAAIGSSFTIALPLVLAFQAGGEAVVEFKDSIAAAGEEIDLIGIATQQTLLPALDEALTVLLDLVQPLAEFGLFVGRSVGDFALLFANVLTGEKAIGRLQKILQSALRIFDLLAPTIINVGDILSGIWVAAIPASERLVGTIRNLTSRWAEMVNEGLRTGTIVDTFDLWYDRAQTLGSALGNLTGALFDILQVGANSSDDVFQRFDEWAERFRDFTESEVGQNKLALIFDNALEVMREVNGVVADLFDGIFGRLDEIGGVDSLVASLQRFREVLPGIQESWSEMYGQIKEVVEFIIKNFRGKVGQAIEELAEPLGRLGQQILDLLSAIEESGAFEFFLDLLRILTNVLSTLLAIPGFGTFIGYIIALHGAAKIAGIALVPFVAALRPAIPLLASAIGAFPPLGAALVIGGALFYEHQQTVQAWRQEVRQAVDALGTFNGGLLITAEGIAKYITESSRFADNDLSNLTSMGFTVDSLAASIEHGTLSYRDFADAAVEAGQINFEVVDQNTGLKIDVDPAIDSLQELGSHFRLTEEQLADLSEGGEAFVGTLRITPQDTNDLIRSFEELNDVIGQGVKDNIGAFVSDGLNLELLGPAFLNDLKTRIDQASPEGAIKIQREAYDLLRVQAELTSLSMVGVSEETRRQIEEQASTAGSAVEIAVTEMELLRREQQRVFTEIRSDFELFNSDAVAEEFGAARQAVFDFSDTIDSVGENIEPFDAVVALGIDTLLAVYPQVADATLNLFDQLSTLPEDEFNAFATALGADAENLRIAMEGARQAIADLQEQAIASLPTIGSLLQDATSVQEDGSQFFDPAAFLQSAEERIAQTDQFSTNIAEIARDGGQELARLATQQGPEAAASIVELLGSSGPQLNEVIARMEESEAALATQIHSSLGPAIALEYATAAKLVGSEATIGLSQGLNNPVAVAALLDSGEELANMIASQLEFTVLPTENGFRFVNKPRNRDINRNLLSEGGYVDDQPTFNNGPFGTDTVNAWLTPGEFVLRRAVAQAIPRNVLMSLNAGDTRMIGLLNGLNKTRPQGVDAVVASVTATVPGRPANGGFTIQQMNIEAPTPLESARQVADRLRIMQSQLSSR